MNICLVNYSSLYSFLLRSHRSHFHQKVGWGLIGSIRRVRGSRLIRGWTNFGLGINDIEIPITWTTRCVVLVLRLSRDASSPVPADGWSIFDCCVVTASIAMLSVQVLLLPICWPLLVGVLIVLLKYIFLCATIICAILFVCSLRQNAELYFFFDFHNFLSASYRAPILHPNWPHVLPVGFGSVRRKFFE